MKKIMKIEGMTCGHCQNAVESALANLPEVDSVTVDLENNSAEVDVLNSTTDEILRNAVEEKGYKVVSIS